MAHLTIDVKDNIPSVIAAVETFVKDWNNGTQPNEILIIHNSYFFKSVRWDVMIWKKLNEMKPTDSETNVGIVVETIVHNDELYDEMQKWLSKFPHGKKYLDPKVLPHMQNVVRDGGEQSSDSI